MLFDLRGRGRRRTVQVIYASLAILLGGGLVLFGIGGDVNGGLIDGLTGNDSGSNNKQLEDQTKDARDEVAKNPRDARAWAILADREYRLAGQTDGFSQKAAEANQPAFKGEARERLLAAEKAWDRHIELAGDKGNVTAAGVARQMFSKVGLNKPDKVVRAQEILLASNPDPGVGDRRLEDGRPALLHNLPDRLGHLRMGVVGHDRSATQVMRDPGRVRAAGGQDHDGLGHRHVLGARGVENVARLPRFPRIARIDGDDAVELGLHALDQPRADESGSTDEGEGHFLGWLAEHPGELTDRAEHRAHRAAVSVGERAVEAQAAPDGEARQAPGEGDRLDALELTVDLAQEGLEALGRALERLVRGQPAHYHAPVAAKADHSGWKHRTQGPLDPGREVVSLVRLGSGVDDEDVIRPEQAAHRWPDGAGRGERQALAERSSLKTPPAPEAPPVGAPRSRGERRGAQREERRREPEEQPDGHRQGRSHGERRKECADHASALKAIARVPQADSSARPQRRPCAAAIVPSDVATPSPAAGGRPVRAPEVVGNDEVSAGEGTARVHRAGGRTA